MIVSTSASITTDYHHKALHLGRRLCARRPIGRRCIVMHVCRRAKCAALT